MTITRADYVISEIYRVLRSPIAVYRPDYWWGDQDLWVVEPRLTSGPRSRVVQIRLRRELSMPNTEVNRYFWDKAYNWSDGGDEWSSIWGGIRTNGTAASSPEFNVIFRLIPFWRSHPGSDAGRSFSPACATA